MCGCMCMCMCMCVCMYMCLCMYVCFCLFACRCVCECESSNKKNWCGDAFLFIYLTKQCMILRMGLRLGT